MIKYKLLFLPNFLLAFVVYISLLLTICSSLYAQTSPMVGTWGHKELGINNGVWFTENNKATLNSNGSGTLEYNRHYDSSGSSGLLTFNYTFERNGDGSYSHSYFIPGTYDITRTATCDDGKIYIEDRLIGSNKLGLAVGVKLDTTKYYNNSDVTGEYYVIGYERDELGYDSGFYRAYTNIISFTGHGGYSQTRTWNGDGAIMASTSIGTYSVNADASMFFDDHPSPVHFSGDGKLAVWSNPNPYGSQAWATSIIMKKGDMNYSTSDLAGFWAITGFGDKPSFHADFGSMDCDSQGKCRTSLKIRNSDGGSSYESFSETFNVSNDGQMLSSVPSLGPNHAAVIGNNGTTIFINRSFYQNDLDNRKIYVAVRCSGCNNLSGQGKGIPATNFLLLPNN